MFNRLHRGLVLVAMGLPKKLALAALLWAIVHYLRRKFRRVSVSGRVVVITGGANGATGALWILCDSPLLALTLSAVLCRYWA